MAVSCKGEDGALLSQENITTTYLLALHAEKLPVSLNTMFCLVPHAAVSDRIFFFMSE